MAKYKIVIGDKIWARSPSLFDEFEERSFESQIIYEIPLEVTEVWKHGVKTREHGYINNNNILGKIT